MRSQNSETKTTFFLSISLEFGLQLMNSNCSHVWRNCRLIPHCLFVVLHGDVHSVHPVRHAVVCLGSLLLEGSAEDPVLDSRGHIPGDGGEGCLLRRIRKHQYCWLCLWVSTLHLSKKCLITCFMWDSNCYVSACVAFSSRPADLCRAGLCPQENFGSIARHHRQPWLWHRKVCQQFCCLSNENYCAIKIRRWTLFHVSFP